MPPLIALSNGTLYTNVPVSPGMAVQVPANYGTKGSQAKWRARYMDTRVMPTVALDPHDPVWNYLAPAAWHERVVDNPSNAVQESAIPGGPVVFTPPGPGQSTANALYDATQNVPSGTVTAASTSKAML